MINPLAEELDEILLRTRGLWDELRNERIFITGGTGFFGCWLLESLAWINRKLDLHASATVLTRNPERLKEKAPYLADDRAIQLWHGNVTNFDFPDGRFSHIIHAATSASAKMNVEDPLLMLDTIVQGTRRTLDFAVKCEAKSLLLTSSGAVYGMQPNDLLLLPEDYLGAAHTMDSGAAYAEGKRVSELLCAIYFRKFGLQTKIARCFSFVGPYLPLDTHYAVGNFLRDGLSGRSIRVKGDGTPVRSYLYAADLVTWLWTILFAGESCRPYNVGSEDAISIRDLAELAGGMFGQGVEMQGAVSKDTVSDSGRYVPSTRRSRTELHLERTTDLAEALRRTATWHQKTRLR